MADVLITMDALLRVKCQKLESDICRKGTLNKNDGRCQ